MVSKETFNGIKGGITRPSSLPAELVTHSPPQRFVFPSASCIECIFHLFKPRSKLLSMGCGNEMQEGGKVQSIERVGYVE